MHRRRLLDPRLALACLVVVGCAPIPPSSKVELPTRQFSLANMELPSGMQVIVEDDASAASVTSALVVGAGAADDPPGQEGLAHLVEHLTFRAHRAGRPSLSTWLALHGIGVWNGITEMDLTSYYLVGPPETVGSMIEAEVGRMLAPLEGVDEDAFKAEVGVVLAELRTRDETGKYNEVSRALLTQLFPTGHPYARGIGGTPESLASLTLAQARAWAADHYKPRNITWVLGGALDRRQVATLLEQSVPAALRDVDPTPAPPASRRPALSTKLAPAPSPLPSVTTTVRRPTLLVGWRVPPMQDRMEPVLAILPALVEDYVWAEGVVARSADILPMDDAAVLMLSLELQPEADAEAVWKKVKSYWTEEAWGGGTLTAQYFVESFFGQVRAASVVELARNSESVVIRTLQRAQRARLTHSGATISAQNAAIARLTYKDVLEAGRLHVTEYGARAVLLRPAAGQEVEPEGKRTMEAGSAFAPESVRTEYPADVLAKFVRGPRLSGVTTFTASNGLEVVSVPRGKTGLVTVTLGVRGGRLTSTPPALADRLLWSRQSFSYHEPAYIGAGLSSWWTDDSGYVEYTGSAGNLPNLLAMLSERMLTRETISPSKATLARASTTPETDAFNRRFWEAVLGPSGAKSQLTVAETAALDGGEAQRWAEQVLNPRTSVLVVAGELKGNLKDEVEHWLGRWHGSEKTTPAALPALPAAPGVLRVVKATLPGTKQLRVRLACTATTASLEDELAFRLLAAELERQWTKVERETLGSSYGFEGSVQAHRDGTMRLLVSGRVDNGSSRRMAVTVAQAWKALGDPGADESRIGRLRWEYARGYNVRFLTSDTVAEDVARHRLRGRQASAVDEIPAALMGVGRTQMAAVGKQCQSSAVLGMLGEASAMDVDAQLPQGARQVR